MNKKLTPEQIENIVEKGLDPLKIHKLRTFWGYQLKRIQHKKLLMN
jgi:hypothetical protein